MRILITGGLGYIGSHTCVALLESGFDIGIVDNLSNCDETVLHRIEQITGCNPILFVGDIRDSRFLQNIFADFQPEAVIHFAGVKSVGESIEQPVKYYDNNVAGTISLVNCMQRADVKTLVF